MSEQSSGYTVIEFGRFIQAYRYSTLEQTIAACLNPTIMNTFLSFHKYTNIAFL